MFVLVYIDYKFKKAYKKIILCHNISNDIAKL